jgi:hypothetical protein
VDVVREAQALHNTKALNAELCSADWSSAGRHIDQVVEENDNRVEKRY